MLQLWSPLNDHSNGSLLNMNRHFRCLDSGIQFNNTLRSLWPPVHPGSRGESTVLNIDEMIWQWSSFRNSHDLKMLNCEASAGAYPCGQKWSTFLARCPVSTIFCGRKSTLSRVSDRILSTELTCSVFKKWAAENMYNPVRTNVTVLNLRKIKARVYSYCSSHRSLPSGVIRVIRIKFKYIRIITRPSIHQTLYVRLNAKLLTVQCVYTVRIVIVLL